MNPSPPQNTASMNSELASTETSEAVNPKVTPTDANFSTNFFSFMSKYTKHSDITLTLRSLPDGKLAVTILSKPLIDDKVKDLIAPVTLRALPTALDAGFFTQVEKPLAQVQEFSMDLSAFEASQKKAALESQKAKKEKEEEDKKRKKSDVHLARAKELEEADKLTEAVSEAQKAVALTPSYEKASKQLTELEEKAQINRQTGLFDTLPKEESPNPTESTPKKATVSENLTPDSKPSTQKESDRLAVEGKADRKTTVDVSQDKAPSPTSVEAISRFSVAGTPVDNGSETVKKESPRSSENPLRTPRSYFNS